MFFGAPAMIEELPGWAVTVFESTKSEYLATVYAKASLAVRAMAIVDMVISDPQVHHACVGAAYLVTHAWHMRRAQLEAARAGLQVVPDAGCMKWGDESITLSSSELQIMIALVRAEGRTLRRASLENAAWGIEEARRLSGS